MIHDALENWAIYFSKPAWHCAFDYLIQLNAETQNSERVTLQGDDIFVSIMSYQTCSPEEAMLETHDEYIDIQVSLVNSEAIDWFPRRILAVKSAYDPGHDRTLYHRPGPAPLRVKNLPGYFTVLFPEDAHMPKQIVADESELVKKVVVKVRKNLIF